MNCRFALASAVIAVAISSLAQTLNKPASDPNAAKKPTGNCTVSGRVVSAADGAPLRSARVGLIQANVRRHPLVYATTTDNEGHFEMKQVEAGRYEFFASHIGFLTQQYQAKGSDDGTVLSLASAQTVSDALFRLLRAAVITGRVLDEGGEPMMGAGISVLRKPSAGEMDDEEPGTKKKYELVPAGSGATDDRGTYRVFGLRPGDYYVKAAENSGRSMPGALILGDEDWIVQEELGSQYAPLFYPGVLQMDQAQVVTVSAGDEAQADFAMRRLKLVEVAGRVVGADGSPPAHAFVRLSVPGVVDWSGDLSAGTDSKGEFSIKGVPPGTYLLSAQQHEQDKSYTAGQRIEVGEEKIDSIVLTFGGGATIHGRIVAYGGVAIPPGRARIHLEPTSEEDVSFTFTEVKKDGTFEILGVADGSYALSVGGLEQGWFVRTARLGSEDALLKGVQVENGAVVGRLEVVVSSDGAQIEGTVTDSDHSQPLAGVQLRARPDLVTDYNRYRSREASTDQNGHFVLKDIPPGKYKVSAKLPVVTSGESASKSDPVAVTLGEHEHRVLDLKLAVQKSE